MASNQPPTRLTKKQKKATAFRDRSHKGKGKGDSEGRGNGKANLPLGHPPRPHSTENNGDEDPLDAVLAMEDQALTEVASGAEGDEGPKAAVGTRPSKGKEKENKRRRRDEDADVGAVAGSAPPRPPKKKPKLARGSDGAPLVAHEEEDDAASIALDDGGHETEKRPNKGSKQPYVLFIGTFTPFAAIADSRGKIDLRCGP
jgi:hypothetical protein